MPLKFKIFIVAFLVPIGSIAANGQPGFSLTTSFQFLNQNRESSVRGDFEDNDLFLDLKIGYALPGGFYFGGIYSSFSDSDEQRSAFGPSIGYQNNGFFIGGSYLIHAEHRIVTESQTLTGGSGYIFEAGYNYPILSFMTVGGNLSYVNLTYKDTEAFGGGSTSISTHNESFFVPMLQLGFFFGSGSSGADFESF